MDPHKRAIYDSVGMKGLEQEGLQIVVRSKTPQEIREEYERLAREKQEREREKLTNSTVLFTSYTYISRIFNF
jgi:DnaJ family protein C protein 11